MMKHLIVLALLGAHLMAFNVIATAGISMGADISGQTDRNVGQSPFGTFGIEAHTAYGVVFYEHTSSVPQVDESMGLNFVGYKYVHDFHIASAYAGAAVRDKELDGSYYENRIGSCIGLIGVEKEYGFASLYVEHKQSLDDGHDLTTFGFRLKFDSKD